MSNEPHRSVRAGAAFKALMDSNPVTKAAWEANRAVKDSPEGRRVIQNLVVAMAASKQAVEERLRAEGLPVPRTIEDWEDLALFIGIAPDQIGSLTIGEIARRARIWAQREKWRLEMLHSIATASSLGRSQGEGEAGSGTQDTKDDYMARLLSVCINDVSDKCLLRAVEVLRTPSLSSNEKLTRLGGLNLIPPDTSAQKLATMLSVSKQAVLKTKWWKNYMANRRSKRK